MLFFFLAISTLPSSASCRREINRAILDDAVWARRTFDSKSFASFKAVCGKFDSSNHFYRNPKKIYDALLKHLTKKMKINEVAAQEIADEYTQLIILERYKKIPDFQSWSLEELRFLSDWKPNRKISRMLDYLALRTDLNFVEKSNIFSKVVNTNFFWTQFRAHNLAITNEKRETVGYLFRGDYDQLYISNDGKIYQNYSGKNIRIFSDGTPEPATVRVRKPGRTLEGLFQDRLPDLGPSIFDSLVIDARDP